MGGNGWIVHTLGIDGESVFYAVRSNVVSINKLKILHRVLLENASEIQGLLDLLDTYEPKAWGEDFDDLVSDLIDDIYRIRDGKLT